MNEFVLLGVGPSSSRGLRTHINAYVTFCTLFSLFLFDSSVRQLQRFVTHLSKTMQSPDSIKCYVSGVRNFFLLMGRDPPDISDYIYGLTLKGIIRFKGHVVKRALPVTPELLAHIFAHVDFNDTKQMVAWVALLVGFYTFFRKSNLVPESSTKFNPAHQLCRHNVYKCQFIYIIRVYWAKNIQFSRT